jgi:hypothetical protein
MVSGTCAFSPAGEGGTVSEWRWLHGLATITSPWVTVFAERWRDDSGSELDYWRVERPDSVIVIPEQDCSLLLPHPSFRPGVGGATLDFPGGRVAKDKGPADMVPLILARELGIPADAITAMSPINNYGWAVDSSFSNQRLWGFSAHIDRSLNLSATALAKRVRATKENITDLLDKLECLQCRALLMEWWIADELSRPRSDAVLNPHQRDLSAATGPCGNEGPSP